MFKKVIAFLTVIFMIAALSMNCFATKPEAEGGAVKEKVEDKELKEAEKKLDNIMKSKDTEPTDEFLIIFTRPKSSVSFEKEAVILGYSIKNNISVNVLVYDDESDSYVKYEDSDNPEFGSWDINESYKFFRRSFQLKKDMKIRVVSYVKSEIKDLKAGKNLQINDFTFNLLKEPSKENKSAGFVEYSNMVNGIK